MTVCTISPEDIDELERLNKALILADAGTKEARWFVQARLLRFIEAHPTLLPYLTAAGREKQAHADSELTV